MLYVHVAENHRPKIPVTVMAATQGEFDPDRRVLKLLGARGSHMAADEGYGKDTSGLSAAWLVRAGGLEPYEDSELST